MKLIERKNCPMRRKNGDCLVMGRFCLYVNDEICHGLHNAYNKGVEAEPQRAYEQGVKDTLDKDDETFRIASEIRIAVGCKTAKECWELARNGDIQVVKHGRWINKDDKEFECSHCGNLEMLMSSYCRRCGAKMDEVEE